MVDKNFSTNLTIINKWMMIVKILPYSNLFSFFWEFNNSNITDNERIRVYKKWLEKNAAYQYFRVDTKFIKYQKD